jgi:hypothetical protein
MGKLKLKTAGVPAHINPREDEFLKHALPEAAGKVVKSGLLAEAGRYGDDRVTLLNASERARLKRRGGSGDRNPNTGLLEYGDGMGGSDNPGGGHNADGGASQGGYGGGGVSSSPGDSSSYSGGTSYGPARDVGYSWGNAPTSYRSPDDPYGGTLGIGLDGRPYGAVVGRGLEQRAYDPTTMPGIESLLNTPNGYRDPGYRGLSMHQYSPPDTFGRLVDTYLYGPPPSYTERGKVPGNLSAPTGLGPGMVGKAVTNLAGPAGPMMSAMMSLGMHMDQAMSPETRAASLEANQAQGAKNSTGRDNDTSPAVLEARASGTQYAGTTSGAETAKLPQVPPGYSVNPAGQLIPLPGNNRSAIRDPIQNLLYDYLLRGPSGRGWA